MALDKTSPKVRHTQRKTSGILLHVTSLPGGYGIGDLGPEAYEFVDELAKANQSYWQVLPLNPPTIGLCPYSCGSAFAGNPLLISPEMLFRDGLLARKELSEAPKFPSQRINYKTVCSYKNRLFASAYKRFESQQKRADYDNFRQGNKKWLEDYTIFLTLQEHFGNCSWSKWPAGLRDRKENELKAAKEELKDVIEREKFLQYVFFKQWSALKSYCNSHHIAIIGDLPIYMAYESADVWGHSEFFKLTKTKKPRFIAGVPPDYFSKTGQLWGNPVYDWPVLKDKQYSWWVERVEHNLRLFDMVRLDHFRGFVAYWQVRAGNRTAKSGKWVKGPGADFFDLLFERVERKSIIAEDLGHITKDVRELVEQLELPGMKVVQFAFGDDQKNLDEFFNRDAHCLIYTGTHDNNTIKGWFAREAKTAQKQRLFDYLGKKVTIANIHTELIKLAMSSAARICIIPMQDILGLGERTRMNTPGTTKGNWSWRLKPGQVTPKVIEYLANMTDNHNRVIR